MTPEIRKIVTFDEETLIEGFRKAEQAAADGITGSGTAIRI